MTCPACSSFYTSLPLFVTTVCTTQTKVAPAVAKPECRPSSVSRSNTSQKERAKRRKAKNQTKSNERRSAPTQKRHRSKIATKRQPNHQSFICQRWKDGVCAQHLKQKHVRKDLRSTTPNQIGGHISDVTRSTVKPSPFKRKMLARMVAPRHEREPELGFASDDFAGTKWKNLTGTDGTEMLSTTRTSPAGRRLLWNPCTVPSTGCAFLARNENLNQGERNEN